MGIDINKEKLQEALGKLSFLKDFSSLIIPAIIIIAALAVLGASSIITSKKREAVERQSVSIGKQVISLKSEPVSHEQAEIERSYQEKFAQDANQITFIEEQSSRRELLSYEVFPEPESHWNERCKTFGKSFCEKIDQKVTNLNGRDCPTEYEINRAKGEGVSSPESGKYSEQNRTSRVYNEDVKEDSILEALCQAKAKSASVYMNPIDIEGYLYWKNYDASLMIREEAILDCWFWQLGYWIAEDVVKTIGAVNTDSNSVFNSPVKRLLYLGFTPEGMAKIESSGSSKGSSGRGEMQRSYAPSREMSEVSSMDGMRPYYITSEEDAFVPSFTGRVAGEKTDVLHFYVSVLVENESVMPFMEELCSGKTHVFRGFDGKSEQEEYKHNQITILSSTFDAIDRKSPEHNLYRYGNKPVVRLNLVCEYLFSKVGYKEIEPSFAVEEAEKEPKSRSRSRSSGQVGGPSRDQQAEIQRRIDMQNQSTEN